jgi:hypothetical protein
MVAASRNVTATRTFDGVILIIGVREMLSGCVGFCHCAYQSECGDHRLQEGSFVEVYW